MANISRDTYELNKDKNYVAVRLQQGVPLVDADWNEMNDIVRRELYDSLSLGLSDGVAGMDDFRVEPVYASIYRALPGSALIGGRFVTLRDAKRFHLRGPRIDRTDLVYLDTWESEVGSDQDPDLVNPLIGIETSVRFKREVEVRIQEDIQEGVEASEMLPTPDPGHFFFPLALFVWTDPYWHPDIQDLRPTLKPRGVSFAPSFIPTETSGRDWKTVRGEYDFVAEKPRDQKYVSGALFLTLRDGMRLGSIQMSVTMDIISGEGSVKLDVKLCRIARLPNRNADYFDLLPEDIVYEGSADSDDFEEEITWRILQEDAQKLIDNNLYTYYCIVHALQRPIYEQAAIAAKVTVQGIRINYQ